MKTPSIPQTNANFEAVEAAISSTSKCGLETTNAVVDDSNPILVQSMPAECTGEVEQWNERLMRVRATRFDGLRFLLVDDSPDNQKLFQRILIAAGAVVDIAENGVAAIERFRDYSGYDLIVMDIRMPIVDGYEATRQIRSLGYTNPIVALTAHATPGEEEKCRLAGCSDFHLKPIDRLSLLTAVSEAMASIAD